MSVSPIKPKQPREGETQRGDTHAVLLSDNGGQKNSVL